VKEGMDIAGLRCDAARACWRRWWW